MKVQMFSEYRMINEEFIGGLIKGALGNLFNLFSAPFKDLANDIKNTFKPDDLSTIKDIILTNFNQSIDGVIKEIPKINEEGALTDIMPKMVDQLVQLANNLEKDVTQGLGKDKAPGFMAAAKAVILGNNQAKWQGLVGSLDPNNAEALKFNGGIKINYKYNKAAYEKALTDAGSKGGNVLEAKKKAAISFFGEIKKDVNGYIEKELSDEELTTIYNTSGGKQAQGGLSAEILKSYGVEKKDQLVGKQVRYKTKKYDNNKKPEDQPDAIGQLKVLKVTPDGLFLDGEKEDFEKKDGDIVAAGGEQVGANAKKAAEVLGKIKTDEEKMSKVVKFAEFLQDEANKDKVGEIEKMMGAQAAAQKPAA